MDILYNDKMNAIYFVSRSNVVVIKHHEIIYLGTVLKKK